MIQQAFTVTFSLFGRGWQWWWEVSSKSDELARMALTLCMAFLAMGWCRWRCSISESKKPLLPPGPRGLPLVGSLPFLGPDLHHCFAELARSYGPIMKIWLGSKLCIVISSPAIAKEVFRENDVIFANHDLPIAARIISYGGANLVRCPYGPTWRAMRRVFNQDLLSHKTLDACYDLRRRVFRQLVEELHSKSGTPVNVGELAQSTSLNLLTSMLWGEKFECEAIVKDFQELVMETISLLRAPNISDFFPLLAWFDVQGIERRMRKCISNLDQIYKAIMEERMSLQARHSKDLLFILLQLMDDGGQKKPLTETNLKALIMDILVGGTSTMATAVEWAMAELIDKPEIMRRAREELKQVVGAEPEVQERHIARLHYLRAVLKETLRLHAVVPLLVPRVPSQSCIVGGYLIPKGARVMTNVWAIHRDPEVWEEPLEFRPDRFLRASRCGSGEDDFRFFPFGSGRRKCAGLPLAERMLPLLVATLLHSFEWQAPEGTELELSEMFGVTLTMANPLIAIPKCGIASRHHAIV